MIGGDKFTAEIYSGNSETLNEVVSFLSSFDFGSKPCKITIESLSSTLEYKAVFWIWMRELAKSFSERDKTRDYTAQDMHILMCHKFLGYTDKEVMGRTVIEPALRTITYPDQLTRGEFYDLMRKIEIWSSDVGVILPDNKSQYSEDRKKSEK